eukprot:TRINITY_DN7805_c0_g2_i1.p1 TRINITY_DN7805_c0_g2~~TRINITY_DN7805_c0_g2_i1.p1  ORF type:complete len:352 (+),score=11.72 TRINITY_DN7805_c0_g2_i1:88-1056(+)
MCIRDRYMGIVAAFYEQYLFTIKKQFNIALFSSDKLLPTYFAIFPTHQKMHLPSLKEQEEEFLQTSRCLRWFIIYLVFTYALASVSLIWSLLANDSWTIMVVAVAFFTTALGFLLHYYGLTNIKRSLMVWGLIVVALSWFATALVVVIWVTIDWPFASPLQQLRLAGAEVLVGFCLHTGICFRVAAEISRFMLLAASLGMRKMGSLSGNYVAVQRYCCSFSFVFCKPGDKMPIDLMTRLVFTMFFCIRFFVLFFNPSSCTRNSSGVFSMVIWLEMQGHVGLDKQTLKNRYIADGSSYNIKMYKQVSCTITSSFSYPQRILAR